MPGTSKPRTFDMEDTPGAYIPTREAIEAECAQIRKEWRANVQSGHARPSNTSGTGPGERAESGTGMDMIRSPRICRVGPGYRRRGFRVEGRNG